MKAKTKAKTTNSKTTTNGATTKRILRDVERDLTEAEQRLRADTLATLIGERTVIETDLSAYGAEKRKRLREIKREEKRLTSEIHEGKGLVETQCEEVSIFSTNTFEVRVVATGEVVERRAMTADERQGAQVEAFDEERIDLSDDDPLAEGPLQ